MEAAVSNSEARRSFALNVFNGALLDVAARLIDPPLVLTGFVRQLAPSNLFVGPVTPLSQASCLLRQVFFSCSVQRVKRKIDSYSVAGLIRVIVRFLVSCRALVCGCFSHQSLQLLSALHSRLGSRRAVGPVFFRATARTSRGRRRGSRFAWRQFLRRVPGLGARWVVKTFLHEPRPHLLRGHAILFLLYAVKKMPAVNAFVVIHEPAADDRADDGALTEQLRRALSVIRRNQVYRRCTMMSVALAVAEVILPFYRIYVNGILVLLSGLARLVGDLLGFAGHFVLAAGLAAIAHGYAPRLPNTRDTPWRRGAVRSPACQNRSVTVRPNTNLPPLEPPAEIPEIQRGNWLALEPGDPVVSYLVATLRDGDARDAVWKVARLSQAAYVYRETSTGWAVVAKFYSVKAGTDAAEYAERERDRIRRVRDLGLVHEEARAVPVRGLWRGVLFLEYVPGITLENIIAVRHSQPGSLTDALHRMGCFLAELHVRGLEAHVQPQFGPSVAYARDLVRQVAKHGVLQDDPVAQDGALRLIDRWATSPEMEDFVPTLTHGDATTTNAVFPGDGSIVVVDWERLYSGDAASDLGRLMAEVTHSVNQHGGSVQEAQPFVEQMCQAYQNALPDAWDVDALIGRARFYRASSTLRIARNGWVSRLDRTALVAHAMALLAL